jgi:hypothetical protein
MCLLNSEKIQKVWNLKNQIKSKKSNIIKNQNFQKDQK